MSSKSARPFDLAWARSTIAQCRAANVACFVKQLGAKPFDSARTIDIDAQTMLAKTGNTIDLVSRKGGDIDEWDADLRVRQFPEARS